MTIVSHSPKLDDIARQIARAEINQKKLSKAFRRYVIWEIICFTISLAAVAFLTYALASGPELMRSIPEYSGYGRVIAFIAIPASCMISIVFSIFLMKAAIKAHKIKNARTRIDCALLGVREAWATEGA